MAEIIDDTQMRSQGNMEEIQITLENVTVVNDTDSSVKSLTISGFGDVPRGSSKQIASLKFSQITIEGEDGERYDLFARGDGMGGNFSNQDCIFSGPDFGSVTLKGQQFGEAVFTPKF